MARQPDLDEDLMPVATQEALAGIHCGTPGCACEEVSLGAACCQDDTLKATYVKADRIIVLRCAGCDTAVLAIPVMTEAAARVQGGVQDVH